jgi:hypothetical protein
MCVDNGKYETRITMKHMINGMALPFKDFINKHQDILAFGKAARNETLKHVKSFRNAVDIGDQSWAIVGASQSNSNQGYVTTIYVKPGSNFFEQRQLLVAPDQDFANGEFGYAWDRNLTDEDGPYIELMTGVFTDNQPDFSWIMPNEEKRFTF